MGFKIVNDELKKYIPAEGEINAVIPEGILKIGSFAFSRCNTLQSVTLPEGIKFIGDGAFGFCNNLKTVILPQSLKWIRRQAFINCQQLCNVVLPAGLEEIDVGAFVGCEDLIDITIPDGVQFNSFHSSGGVFSANTRVHIADIMALLPDDRINAVLGIAAEDKIDVDSQRAQAHFQYIKQQAAKPKMIETAIQTPSLLLMMCQYKLITAARFDLYMAEAERAGNIEAKTALLDYQQNVLTSKKVASARKQKEQKKAQDTEKVIDKATQRSGKEGIDGLVFAITGKLKTFDSRDAAKAWLEEHGAKLASGVSANVDYLVTNDTDTGSEKNEKARSLGIQVIDENKFNYIVGRRFRDSNRVIVPQWVRHIADSAFEDCKSAEEIILHEQITDIGSSAFVHCGSLTKLYIPAAVKTIDRHAFYPGYNTESHIESIEVASDSAYFTSVDGVLFNKSKTELIHYPDGRKDEAYTVPDGVLTIVNNAFSNCTYLRSLTIASSVSNLDCFAISGCENLSELLLLCDISSLNDLSINGCSSIKHLRVEHWSDALNELTKGWNLNSIETEHPETVPAKYRSLITQSTAKTDVVKSIPESIEGLVFLVSGKLETFENRDDVQAYLEKYGAILASSLTKKVKYLVTNEAVLSADKANKVEKFGIQVIDERMFNLIIRRRFADTEEVIVPIWLTEIEDHAFENCSEVRKIVLPATIKSIGESAFQGCSNLEEISLPEGLQSIGWYAFSGCEALKTIVLPSTVKSLTYSFLWRDWEPKHIGLDHIEVAHDSRYFYSIDGVLFSKAGSAIVEPNTLLYYPRCRNAEKYIIPDGTVSIESNAFEGCNKIVSIEMPESLEAIGTHAFASCSALRSVVIPENITEIDDDAFSDCISLENVTFNGDTDFLEDDFGECRIFGREPKVKRIHVQSWSKGLTESLQNAPLEEIYADDADAVPAELRHFLKI